MESASVSMSPTVDGEAIEIDHPPGPASVRSIPIEMLVEAGPASVRLRNTILQGAYEGLIPCQTVGDYLDAGPQAAVLFMTSLKNFGLKTARELDALVAGVLDNLPRHPGNDAVTAGPTTEDDAAQRQRTALLERIAGMTYADAIRGEVPSTRLTNILIDPAISSRQVGELLFGGAVVRADLLCKPNFGRKSLVELEGLSQRSIIRALAKGTSDPEALLSDCGLLFGTTPDQTLGLANQILDALSAGPPRDGGFDGLIAWAVNELSDRERDVLERRYGLKTAVSETLEEIGARYRVTRERIRQLEAKALRRLRRKLEDSTLPDMLKAASWRFWSDRDLPYLQTRDSHQVRRELPGELNLALDIAQISLDEWLAQTSTAMRYGFLCHTKDAETVRSLGAKFDRVANERALPLALRDLGDLDPALAEAAICIETRLAVLDGYLLADRPFARLKRTIRLHAILADAQHAMSLYALGGAYSRRHGDDVCMLRDLAIVMEVSPQLFLEIEDGLWTALGRGGGAAPASLAEAARPLASDIDPMTIAGALQQALRQRGPTSVGDLYRDGAAILPEGRSRNSVAPVLVSRPDLFHRILPGVYALHEQRLAPEEVVRAPLPYLLTEPQARAYAFARQAGESWETYPLWGPAAEYRICAWAKFNAPDALFHSLLSVAETDAWPIDERERAEWARLASQRGRFELPISGREPHPEHRPELDRLLAACRITQDRGSLNWLLVNRMMGRRLDAAGGQGLLALMIALGCVTPPAAPSEEARLLPHPVGPNAAVIANKIEAALMHSGELDWDSPTGKEIAAQALLASQAAMGWASLSYLAGLLDGSSDVADCEAAQDEDEDGDDLIARLMREHRRGSERNKRQEAAAWLLEE